MGVAYARPLWGDGVLPGVWCVTDEQHMYGPRRIARQCYAVAANPSAVTTRGQGLDDGQ